jgi:hypothetical protein
MKMKKELMLIDVPTSGYTNTAKTEADMNLKYKDLTIKIQWNVKTNVIPVITSATGIISKFIQKILEQRTGKARNQGTTENSHTDTTHMLQKVLM